MLISLFYSTSEGIFGALVYHESNTKLLREYLAELYQIGRSAFTE